MKRFAFYFGVITLGGVAALRINAYLNKPAGT